MTTYDIGHLAQLRKDAEFNAVDFARGRIEAAGDGTFVVHLSRPIVDISRQLDPMPPLTFTTHSALQAEGWMLDRLLKIQRAERKIVRLGRVCSWSTEQITRTPLRPEELASFKADIEHRQKVTEMQAQLSKALQAKARRQSTEADAKALRARYGMQPAQAVPEVAAVAIDEPEQPQAAPTSIADLLTQSAQATPAFAGRQVTASPSKRRNKRGI